MSNESADRITDAELEVMKVLWKEDQALPVNAIRDALKYSRGWEATTVKTLVSRLVEKQVLLQEKRNVFYYSSAISKREYEAWAARDLIKRVYNGSAKALMAALVDSDGLSREDIDELKRMFDEGTQA